MQTTDSPWAVLGLDEGATLDEVRHAFREEAKRTHPDHGGDRARFEALRTAYGEVRRLAPNRPRTTHPRPPKPVWGARPNPYDWSVVSPVSTIVSPGSGSVTPRRHRRPTATVVAGAQFAAVLETELARAGVAA